MESYKSSEEIENSYRVSDGFYILGSLESGVTIYNQQIRAHNLAWALSENQKFKNTKQEVAIVGAGISGLTLAACLMSLCDNINITILERLWDLSPFQQGADTRWIHPRIYEWPDLGSRSPSASMPHLNWSEGRASDVARAVLNGFNKAYARFGKKEDKTRISIFIGVDHLQVFSKSGRVEWRGSETEMDGNHFKISSRKAREEKFDSIILASGFGLERSSDRYSSISYWRNESFGQPVLLESKEKYIISGYGDGAIVDLCRLTIERFRQDTILYELFGTNLENVEDLFRKDLLKISNKLPIRRNLYSLFLNLEKGYLNKITKELNGRIRKDTDVIMHLKGTSANKHLSDAFYDDSSVLNRLLLFFLYRCGAVGVTFDELEVAVKKYGVSPDRVLCRHGADTMGHIRAIDMDFMENEKRLAVMKEQKRQTPIRRWPPGVFPT